MSRGWRVAVPSYRLEHLPLGRRSFDQLPYSRGHLDTLLPEPDGALRVSGWLTTPGDPLDAIEVLHDGVLLGTYPLLSRPDVKGVYPWLRHAELSGFNFVLPLPDSRRAITSRLDIAGVQRGDRRCRLSQLVRADVDELPTPPDDYIYRVSHIRNPHSFKVSGLKTLGDLLEAFSRHADITKPRRILDWGCGCGRLAMFLLAASDCPEFAGCDIDEHAIAWCNDQLADRTFSVVDVMPPTPYPDGHFDFIYAYSVLTHLEREVQRAWLEEMHRLLAPGGVLVATTHGQLAYSFACGSLSATFPREGIVDSSPDDTLGSVAPKGYYRSTYQSRDYTCREFSRYFSVLEYVERGAANFQDVIVVTK